MSSSPPPTPKKARPKPKARMAIPSDEADGSRLNVRASVSADPPSRSPSAPASQSTQHARSRPSSDATPIVLSSSPEPENATASSSSQRQSVKVKPEPVARRSSRPTASPLKRTRSGDHPTWAAIDDAEEDEDDIEEIGSSLEIFDDRQASTAAAAKADKDRLQRDKADQLRIAEERQRAEDARFEAQFAKKEPRWINKNSPAASPAKGKSKAASLPESDDDEEMADEQAAGSSDSDVDGTPKKRKKAQTFLPAKKPKVHDWAVKQEKNAAPDSDSDLEILNDDSSRKTKKASAKEKKPVLTREKSASLTPPPEVDQAILQKVNTTVRAALAPDEENPLLQGNHDSQPASDDDFEFNAPPRPPPSRSVQPPSQRVNAHAGPSNSNGPITIDDSSDDDNAAPPVPVQRMRNSKTFDAPMEVRLAVKVVSHMDPNAPGVSERAIKAFEKTSKLESVNRMDTLEEVFRTVAQRTGYPLQDVVLTMNNRRLFRNTVLDSLDIWADATIVGYRKDIYERQMAERKLADKARIASIAAEADDEAQQNAPPPPGSDDGDESDHGNGHADHHSGTANGDGDHPRAASNSPRLAPAAPPKAASTEKKLRITLRGSHGEAKLAAKLTHTIAKLLQHYGNKHQLSKEEIEGLKLEGPDGEEMDPQTTLGDFDEVEDEDMLTVLG